MKRSKGKIVTVILMAAAVFTLLTACGGKADAGGEAAVGGTDAAASEAAPEAAAEAAEDTAAADAAAEEGDEEVPYRDQGVKYMGGLKSTESGVDMQLAFFRLNGEAVAIMKDGEDYYYGEYTTEDTKFDDGKEFTLIDINGTKFGYYFNDDMSGFIVDNDDNIFDAAELDENTALELLSGTGMDIEAEAEPEAGSFVEVQAGTTEFKDYDEVIANLQPGQGYAYIKLYGRDDDILAVTETVFEADDSSNEAHLYGIEDGKVKYMGVVSGNGSAYPLRLADGIIYGGDNHTYESMFISAPYNSLMQKDYVSDGINDGTNEYTGFLRDTNDYDHDKDFTGGEKEFQELITERDKKPVIVFTKIS